MTQNLEWFSSNEHHEGLTPAKAHVPQWYKNIPLTTDNQRKFRLDRNGNKTHSVKACVPFFDAMTTGYFLTTQQDLQVELVDGKPEIAWPNQPPPLQMREVSHMQVPSGYHRTEYIWMVNETLRAPKGFSLLITHPLNRFDLPFISMSGLVDADEIMQEGQIPFFLKKDFEGIIKKGTPMLQVIPIQRHNWFAIKNEKLRELADKAHYRSSSTILGFYKNNFWKPKHFD